MRMSRNSSRKRSTFDFWEYVDSIAHREKQINTNSDCSEVLLQRLGRVAQKANSFLDAKGMFGQEIAIPEDELGMCRIAVVKGGKIALEQLQLPADEDELIATYAGLHILSETLSDEDLGLTIDYSHIVHKILVDAAEISDPLLVMHRQQYAVLPLANTDAIEIFEEDPS